MRLRNDPKLIIVDLRAIMMEHSSIQAMFPIYQKFPLSKMIETILSVSMFQDFKEVLMDSIFKAFDQYDLDMNNDRIDYGALDILIESMALQLDEVIRHAVRHDVESTENYVFDRWLDSWTVVMKLINN